MLNLDEYGPEVFRPTPIGEVTTNVRYEEAYYSIVALEDEGKLVGPTVLHCHDLDDPLSLYIGVLMWDWITTANEFYGFSGMTLFEIYLSKPVQRGPRHVQPGTNPHLTFVSSAAAEEIDPDLFPQSHFSPASDETYTHTYDVAIYHFALVKWQVNDYLHGSRLLRPPIGKSVSELVHETVELLIESLAALGVAGKVIVEVYLPRPIRRGRRSIQE